MYPSSQTQPPVALDEDGFIGDLVEQALEFFGLGGRSLGDLDRQVLEVLVLTNTGSWSDHGVIVCWL